MSKHSSKIDEFYATSKETAEWFAEVLRERYTLAGKTALEPCVGGFVFPDTITELKWSTNDLNKWTDRDPDTISDFLETDFSRFDFVITNPPFGAGNKLAHNFLKKCSELSDIVAMVVPSSMGALNPRLHNLLPKDFNLVFTEKCPSQWFDLPDGTRRDVRTHAVIWERQEGYEREAPAKPIVDDREPFFYFCDDGEFAIRVYGDGAGDIRTWDPACKGTWARFNCQKNKQIVALKLIMSFPWRHLIGSCGRGRAPWDDSPGTVPNISPRHLLHWTNCVAVCEGRIPPKEGVNYDLFLEEAAEKLLVGLQAP